ncbi:MAG: LytTR family DNA-binding domain-containing protein [Bacteroidia bacterium]|jgi:two-component system LytT family response regulator|nr:LytTR family DNA-binding domain-containing protein [Bacteroidia bacterium]
MNAIIVDDEKVGAETLMMLIRKYCPEIHIMSLIHHAPDAADEIQRLKPDLIFLDIEMPFMNGFDVLTKVHHLDFALIFTTAWDHYALQAVRHSAIDYLLKPIDPEDLQDAVAKAYKRNTNYYRSAFETLSSELKLNQQIKRLAIPSQDSIIFVEWSQIVYLEADSNYTHIYTVAGKKHTVSRTLKEYDELLDKQDFFRIHHTFLINLNHVEKYIKGDGGYVLMSNGNTIDVARRKKNELLQLLTGTNQIERGKL